MPMSTASRRLVANPLALAVMAELLIEPLHPYEIGRRLTAHSKDRDFNYNRGSLYMVVSQLEKAGLVAEQETIRDTQRPERTLYALTDQGRAELFDWLHELVAEPRHEYPQFGMAMSLLAIVEPLDAAVLMRRRLETLTAQVDEIRASLRAAAEDGVAWIFLVDEDYRATILDAERAFVERVLAQLEEPSYQKAWHEHFEARR
jgi:DNA-binding PadR family transcriptional regulator